MRIKESELKYITQNSIMINFTNGMRKFVFEMDKEDIKYDDLLTGNFHVKVINFKGTCCGSAPIIVLESGTNEKDEEEIREMISFFIEKHGPEIKAKLNR